MTSCRYLTRLALLGLPALLLAGCSFLTTWEPGVVIPPEHYRIDNLRCEPQPGVSVVDGEDVDTMHWIAYGELVNLLDEGSPHYDVRVTTEFDDGTLEESQTVVFSMIAGDSTEFSAFIGSQVDLESDDTTVSDCRVDVVYDSVLNHG